jgi:hypothetical protein
MQAMRLDAAEALVDGVGEDRAFADPRGSLATVAEEQPVPGHGRSAAAGQFSCFGLESATVAPVMICGLCERLDS